MSRRSIAFSAASTSTSFDWAASAASRRSSCACSIWSSPFFSLSMRRSRSTSVTLPGTLACDSSAFLCSASATSSAAIEYRTSTSLWALATA